ncbi:MAG: inorganic pyrophosphatase [Candidatus Nomurabacteria bacterium]|nr:inorganic pyrophosphatase [Candidatus Nomurabacteria bacterium]
MKNNLPSHKSLGIAREFLGKYIEVIFDRPFGSKHPKYGFVYEVNYGYIPGVMAGDGEELDAYFLGENIPLEKAKGIVIAIIHRENDDDDKLVITKDGIQISDEEIMKYFKSSIIRN